RYHAKGKSVTLSVIAPAPCGDPSRRPMGGGVVARATVSLSARSGAGAGLGDELAIDGSSLSPARGAADGRGASARSGSSRARAGRIRIVAAAMLMSALADGLGHHAEALDAGAPDHVHRLDHRAVGEARVGLEVDGLVLARAESVAEHALEAAGRNALLVQIER